MDRDRVKKLTPRQLRASGVSVDVAVVIDVLRATSTAAALMARGLPELRVVARPSDLERLPGPKSRYLVVSELKETASFSERMDNSPRLAETIALDGRVPVLVTTNGTRALDAAAAQARTVLVASFLNLGAVARHLGAAPSLTVAIVPAGNFERDEARAEDDLCAEALFHLVLGQPVDPAALARRAWQDPLVEERLLKEGGLKEDVEICLEPDRHAIVLEYLRDGDGGLIRRLGT